MLWIFLIFFAMDKIWDRNPSKSEVIVRCGDIEKPE